MQRTIDLQKITENLLNSLVLLLSRTGRTFTKDHFDIYYRVGNATQNKPRNIFIRLLRLGDRGFIIRNRYLIKQIQQYKIVWLNEDLTTLAPQERADLRSIFKAAKAKGLNVKLKPDVILLNGSKYTHSEIDKLPEGLTIEAASTVTTPSGIAFQLGHAPFSNFYPAPFKLDGVQFKHCEQAFQYLKCKANCNETTANSVLAESDPLKVSRLGMRVNTSADWQQSRLVHMKRCIAAKFDQNAELCKKLKETNNTQLIEATVDPYWGAGARLYSPELMNGEWKGKNMLGKLLAEVRAGLQ